MPDLIRAVIFDLGGTLEDTDYDAALRAEAAHGLGRLLVERRLDPRLSPVELGAAVAAGMDAYTRWREQTELELPPERVWAEYVFLGRGLPKKRLQAAAEDLIFFYETHFFRRAMRPEAPAALQTLAENGYRLAVISNIISRSMVPIKLAEYGIAHFFDPILTSSNFGWRKPNERILRSSHGSIDYPLALLRMAAEHGLERAFVHVIFDGRSTEPGSAPALLEKLERQIAAIGVGQVVTGVGRGIALDRNGAYAKTRRAYEALVDGSGQGYAILGVG
jgi:FMN phosphatase YigB (HAD superfamily)